MDESEFEVRSGSRSQSENVYLDRVNDLAMQILRISNLDETLLLLAQSIVHDFEFQNCCIYLLTEDRQRLELRAHLDPLENAPDPASYIELGDGTIGHAAKRGHSQFHPGSESGSHGKPVLTDSSLVVPITYDETVQGVFVTSHQDRDFFTYTHMKVLSAIASVASSRICIALYLEKQELSIQSLEATQLELSEDRERYRMLFDHHPSMVFAVNQKGVIADINAFALNALDYEYDLLKGSLFWAIHPLTERQLIIDMIQSPSQDESISHWESTIVKHGGQQVQMRYTVRRFVYPGEREESLLIIGEDITANYRLAGRLEYEATHDALTGLHNRRHFENMLRGTLLEIGSVPAVLCVADLNGLKLINDSFGHSAGDEFLKRVAEEILNCTTDEDLRARIGGDEFALLFRTCGIEQARERCRELIERIKVHAQHFEHVYEKPISIGFYPILDRDRDVSDVIACADTACYVAKEQLQDSICEFDSDATRSYQRQELSTAALIRQSLDREDVRLYAQKMVNPASGHTAGYEILLRMPTNSALRVTTLDIVRTAERFSMINRLDQFVMKKSLDWIRRYWGVADNLATVCINVSVDTLTNADSFSRILRLVEQSDQTASKICLEISMSAGLSDYGPLVRAIVELKQYGVRIALDNFGQRGATFDALNAMEIDLIKINGRYIREAMTSKRGLKILESMVQLAHSLNIKTTAQHVESDEMLTMVRQAGISVAQGYHIHEPELLIDAVREHRYSNVVQLV